MGTGRYVSPLSRSLNLQKKMKFLNLLTFDCRDENPEYDVCVSLAIGPFSQRKIYKKTKGVSVDFEVAKIY